MKIYLLGIHGLEIVLPAIVILEVVVPEGVFEPISLIWFLFVTKLEVEESSEVLDITPLTLNCERLPV